MKPIVESASFIPVEDAGLRKQLEKVMILFLNPMQCSTRHSSEIDINDLPVNHLIEVWWFTLV